MQPTRVMVVEDERIVALHLRQQLSKLGYQVVGVVASGEQALEKVKELQPDIVLMDIHIEGDLDGIETAARLPAELEIPVVYLTAYSEEATLARARATKPYGYLLKPFAERELHATIQMALERRAAGLALRESEERLRLALDAAEMGSWELDTATRRLLRVGRADQIFGFTPEVFSGTWDAFLEQVHEDDRALVSGEFDRVLEESALCQVEFRGLRAGSGARWLKVQGKMFPAKAGGGRRIVGVVQDVTERRKAEERLRQAATVLEATTDGILILDDQLRVITANHGYCAMTDYSERELLGARPHLLTPEILPPETFRAFSQALAERGQWRSEILGRRKGAEEFPVLTNIVAVAGERDRLTHFVAVFTDMSAVRRAEDELQRLAHYDPVTELPNRLLAVDRLEHSLERAARRHGRVALLFIDLDHFKRINDTLGHDVGDELLRAVAQRMRASVRAEDTVARFGGDEFLVVLEDVERSEHVGRIAGKLLYAIAQPLSLAGTEVAISGSIGISFYPDDGASRDDLIRAADTAMYAAKEMGRQSYSFHTAEMTTTARRHMALDQDLRRAVQRGELTLHYQPQISMRTGEIIGVEALIRRQHGAKGLLGADEVIPIAEKSGLILEMGQWALHEALRQAKEWQDSGLAPLRIAVNVSALQVQRGRLLHAATQALEAAGLRPAQLEIEITESTLQNEPDCLVALQALKRLGVTLAIDDFGTGYSCLSSLKTLPIDRLKIDRVFVRDVPYDQNDVAIVEAIIAMAHKLDLGVVAEGVETTAQADFLRARGCDAAQGYLYARPMPPGQMADLLRARSIAEAERARAGR
jgi:diguanylate cyclase (GGDEF)-like protein/PAS domain S-box-containing protein